MKINRDKFCNKSDAELQFLINQLLCNLPPPIFVGLGGNNWHPLKTGQDPYANSKKNRTLSLKTLREKELTKTE